SGGPRLLDVARDLRDELGLVREGPLLAEAIPELDAQPFTIEVAFEVEQESFDPALGAAVVRVDADRDRGAFTACGSRVDAERRDEQRRVGPQIGGREPERAAALVAGDDGSLDLDGPAEERGRGPHVSGRRQEPDLGRRHTLDVRDDAGLEPETLEQRGIAAPAAAEAEGFTRGDELGADRL